MKNQLLILAIFVFVGGGVAGFLISKSLNSPRNNNIFRCKDYTFINPLLDCNNKFAIKKTGYADLREKLAVYLDNQKNSGKVTESSVYFRDLIDGPWLGIREGQMFNPASLLKLPIMLTFYKMADDNPSLLSKTITIKRLPKDVEKQYFKPEQTVEIGQAYTIEELIKRMIIYSDNHASGVLLDYLYSSSRDSDPLVTTLHETGSIASDQNPLDEISVKSNASFFRILFNPSYLSNKMSEKALELLSQSKFNQGIVGGLPENIKVAHKFGERDDLKDGLNQLHDCGIVYFPANPYLLCVMTRGKDFNDLSATIREVSKMVYDEVNSRKL